MLTPDPERVSAILRAVSETEILPRFRRLGEADSWKKDSGGVVTVADEAAEAFLDRALTGLLPGSVTVGEEAVAADPAILGRLSGEAPVWLIDAIDGTSNFAKGDAEFGVMVALVADGDTRMGWIHDPVGGRTAVAESGAGAWLDGRRLGVGAPAPLESMHGILGARFRRDRALCERFGAVAGISCAAHDYLRLCGGAVHFSYYRRLNPWDHAAGSLMHREAGGCNGGLDGTRYRPGEPPAEGLLLAPDEDSWAGLAAVLREAVQRLWPPAAAPGAPR